MVSGSHSGVILSPREYLSMSGDIFGCYMGMWLSQYIGWLQMTMNYLAKISTALRLRNPGVEYVH